jgi:probable HAF family extracellular repeat protein
MKNKTFVSIAVGMLMLGGEAFAQQYTFIPIDVQCAPGVDASACPAGLVPGQVAAQTSARGINAKGEVVGFYVAGGKQHGFLLSGGQYTSLDFPVPDVRSTFANGINARAEIVGQYLLPVRVKDADGTDLPEDSPLYCPPNLPSPPNPPNTPDPACTKGFHYWRGTFSTVMFPATVDENGQQRKHPGFIAQRITPDGDIYGCLHDHDLGMSMFGAALTRSGAFSLTFAGGELSDPMAIPMSMNNGASPGRAGAIVGLFVDMFNRQHGYVVRGGVFKHYDPTLATTLTSIWDINTSQQFVGTYRESGELPTRRHGFLQNPDDTPATTLDFTCQEAAGCAGAPLGTVAFATIAFGINPAGVIVGQYLLVNNGAAHAFIAIPPTTN